MRVRWWHLLLCLSVGLIGLSFVSVRLSPGLISTIRRHFKPAAPASGYRLADIVEQCQQSVQNGGFGSVILRGQVTVSGGAGRVPVPCKLELAADAHLEILNATIATQHLFITSLSESGGPARVTITGSTLTGRSAGLQISLGGTDSHIEVTDSTLDYDASIGLAAGSGDDDTQASLFISGSTFLSAYAGSEGIILVSTGRATVQNSRFKALAAEAVFLLAPVCLNSNNIGLGNARCQAQ